MFLMRRCRRRNKALSFGKGRTGALLSAQQKKVTFKDVAGTGEDKEELQ